MLVLASLHDSIKALSIIEIVEWNGEWEIGEILKRRIFKTGNIPRVKLR